MKNTGTLRKGQTIALDGYGPCRVESVSDFGALVQPLSRKEIEIKSYKGSPQEKTISFSRPRKAFYISATSPAEVLEEAPSQPNMQVPAVARRHF